MPLGKDYRSQDCSLARSLEILGERWTMLVLRDCFFGVRRFSDFRAHLEIPRAVLSTRLAELTETGVLRREPYRQGRDEYVLTDRGIALWPALFALMQWGERELSTNGPRRLFEHVECGHDVDDRGWCSRCRTVPGPDELTMRPGPGFTEPRTDNPASQALRSPHRLLEPLLS